MSPVSLGEVVLIDGHDLRDVGDGILRQAALLRRNKDVSGWVDEAGVGRKDDGDSRAEFAAVEGIGLNNQDGTSEAWLGSV